MRISSPPTRIGNNVIGGTAGSVLFVDANIALGQNNANFFWDNTNTRLGIGTAAPSVPLHVVGTAQSTNLNITSLTLGSVLFAGASGLVSQNNANFFWDNTNNRLGIGTAAPQYVVDITNATTGGTRLSLTNTNSNGFSQQILNNDTVAPASQILFSLWGSTMAGTAYGLSRNSLGEFTAWNAPFAMGTRHAYPFILGTNNTERMRVLSTGEVGIGTASPSQPLEVITNASAEGIVVSRDNNTVGNANIAFRTRMKNAGNTAYINLGEIRFGLEAADSGNIQFFTRNAGAVDERIRITAAGNVGIGMTPTKQLELSTDSAQKPTTNTWTITSDERIKKDVIPYPQGLDAILQINPIQYHYNDKAVLPEESLDDPYHVGIIAQDVEEVLPELVSRSQGELDGKKTEILAYEGHNLQFMVINALKEIDKRLQTLEKVVIV